MGMVLINKNCVFQITVSAIRPHEYTGQAVVGQSKQQNFK